MGADSSSHFPGAERARASITTPAGEWHLGWDPRLASYWATHRRTAPGGAPLASSDHDLGVGPGACPSVGVFQEALGFALPAVVRAALAADRERRPALASPRSGLVPDPDRPRGVDTYPTWDAVVTVLPDGNRSRYGLALEQEAVVGAADLGEGTSLELLAATVNPATGGQRVEYRLSQEGRVIFAGDDIHAPVGADLGADDSVRALLAVLVDPDAPHRARPMSPAQAMFVASNAERLCGAVEPPAHPYPVGARIAAVVDGARHTGVVTYAASNRDGDALAYAWRPDTAALVGHPWRHHPEHALVSPPDALTPTLAPPFVAPPSVGQPLAFGAIVVAAHPDTGARVEVTVLRSYADDRDGFVYQVQPNASDLPGAFTVAEGDCAVSQGTWWPSRRQLIEARRQAGIQVAPGEVFAASDTDRAVSVVADGVVDPPLVTAAQQSAALTVDADEPSPSVVKVSTHGQLTRVGDPAHGWVVVETDRWLAAMTRPQAELLSIIGQAAPVGTLQGDESKPVLAALAALRAPDALGPTPARLADAIASFTPRPVGIGL